MAEIITRELIENINALKRPKEWNFNINEINLKELNVAVEQVISDEELAKVPTELLFFYEALSYGVPESLPFEKPSWYDDKKFKLGQKFANEFYSAVNYAEMLTLLVLFSFEGNLSTLIYTKRSDTARKAAKRYLSTALRVLSWYEEDVWDKNSVAYKNIQVVRAYHRSTTKKMTSESKEELSRKSKLKNVVPSTEIKCQSLTTLKEDFKGTCPFWVATKSDVIINQAEMSFTLFGFMGLVLLYPEKLGIIGATDEDLGGFVHLWRVLGYLLGIEDRFNMCQGSLDQVRLRCQQIVDKLFIPNLTNLNEEWEHMSRCMIEGVAMAIPGPTFETSSLYLFWLTGVQPTNYRKKLKWKYIVKHYVNRFIMNCIMRCTWIRVRFNTWVKNQMRLKAVSLINEADEPTDFYENR